MAAQVVPQVLDGVEFGAVWRQRDQGEIGRRPQLVVSVEAGLIPEHHPL